MYPPLESGDSGSRLRLPVPTRVLSNGEFKPPPQSLQQREVEGRLLAFADEKSRSLGMGRREFLRSASGMAAAFLAMNQVYGSLFAVDAAEASEPEAAAERRKALQGQFIFDVQLHFVHPGYPWEGLLALRTEARKWNPALRGERPALEHLMFENFLREVYAESDTKVGLLSGAPSDVPERWFLQNDHIARSRALVNELLGSRRLLGHAIFTPGQPGWLEAVDRAVEELRPDSWKGYTIGDPLAPSRYPWRLDDEALVYPAYEKMLKAGIRNVCIHKGLLPPDHEDSFADTWRYARVDDVGKAAKDWPELNFIIYHSGLKPLGDVPGTYLARWEEDGEIPWVSDLARIPREFQVSNVYAELGTCFATSAVTHPRFCAGLLGTLVRGMGADHVLWGTDSVWYGSPQWQIEALRRIEIPEDLLERGGFSALGDADGPVKRAIFGENAARLYGLALPEAG